MGLDMSSISYSLLKRIRCWLGGNEYVGKFTWRQDSINSEKDKHRRCPNRPGIRICVVTGEFDTSFTFAKMFFDLVDIRDLHWIETRNRYGNHRSSENAHVGSDERVAELRFECRFVPRMFSSDDSLPSTNGISEWYVCTVEELDYESDGSPSIFNRKNIESKQSPPESLADRKTHRHDQQLWWMRHPSYPLELGSDWIRSIEQFSFSPSTDVARCPSKLSRNDGDSHVTWHVSLDVNHTLHWIIKRESGKRERENTNTLSLLHRLADWIILSSTRLDSILSNLI